MAGSRGTSGNSGRAARGSTRSDGRPSGRGISRVPAPGTVRGRGFSYAQMAATGAAQGSSANNNNSNTVTLRPQGNNARQPNASAASLARWRGVSNKGRINQRDDCRPGQIVFAPVHTTDIVSDRSQNRDSIRHRDGYSIFSKKRPLVVLWRYDEVFFALPLYTHQGNGIPVERKHEYIRLGHIGTSNAEQITQWLETHPMLTVVKGGTFTFKPNSAVHLPGGVNVKYGENSVVIGAIGTDDWRRLVQIWQDLAGVSVTDFGDYVDKVDSGERFDAYDHVHTDPAGGAPGGQPGGTTG